MRYLILLVLAVSFNAYASDDDRKRTANSAAQVHVTECSNGASAQGKGLGLSTNTQTAQCKAITQANVHIEAYNREVDKESTAAKYHLAQSRYFLQLADEAVEDTHSSGIVSENTNNLLVIGSAIIGLILLL